MQTKAFQPLLIISVAVASSLLGACDSAPSENDVRNAYARQYEIAKASQNPIAKGEMAAIQQLKLIGCMKAGSGGYRCDLHWYDGSTKNARLVKNESTWELVEGN